jgi:hypothetical protein
MLLLGLDIFVVLAVTTVGIYTINASKSLSKRPESGNQKLDSHTDSNNHALETNSNKSPNENLEYLPFDESPKLATVRHPLESVVSSDFIITHGQKIGYFLIACAVSYFAYRYKDILYEVGGAMKEGFSDYANPDGEDDTSDEEGEDSLPDMSPDETLKAYKALINTENLPNEYDSDYKVGDFNNWATDVELRARLIKDEALHDLFNNSYNHYVTFEKGVLIRNNNTLWERFIDTYINKLTVSTLSEPTFMHSQDTVYLIAKSFMEMG